MVGEASSVVVYVPLAFVRFQRCLVSWRTVIHDPAVVQADDAVDQTSEWA